MNSESDEKNQQYDGEDCEESVDCIDSKVRHDVAIFLRDLADKLETNSLSESDSTQISEFFMKFNFLKHLDMENEEVTEGTEGTDSAGEEHDMNTDILKFMSLGWYVYSHLIPRLKDDSTIDSSELTD